MKALVKEKTGPGNVKYYRDYHEPVTARNEVLINVKASAICGTDISIYNWNEEIVKLYNPSVPLIMGHELCGEIVALGDNVNGFEVGQKVAVNPANYCGTCHFCLGGRTNVCRNRLTLGLQIDGGFAELLKVRKDLVFPIPDYLSFSEGTMAEPLAVALHVLERLPVAPGENVYIAGCGGIGMMILLLLSRMYCGQIIMAGTNKDLSRLSLAKSYGASIINVDQEDVIETVMELTKGLGADACFMAAGSSLALKQCFDVCKISGKVGMVGFPHQPTAIPTPELCVQEKELITMRAYTYDTWVKCKNILEHNNIDFSPFISDYAMSDYKKAFEVAMGNEVIRVVLHTAE